MDERAAFKTIGHAIRHRFYVLIAILALFLIGAGVASVIRPPVYQGTAVLRVDERINASQGFDLALQAAELLSAHFIQSATSQPVLQRACSGPNLAKVPPSPLTSPATTAEQTHLTLLQSEYGSTYDKLQALATEQQRLSGSLTLVQTASPPVKPIDPDPLRYLAIALVAGLCIGLAAVVLLDRFDDRLFETEALSQAAGTRLVIA